MGVKFPCDKEIPVLVKEKAGAIFVEAAELGLMGREFIDSCSVDDPKIVQCFVVPLPTRDMRRQVSVINCWIRKDESSRSDSLGSQSSF